MQKKSIAVGQEGDTSFPEFHRGLDSRFQGRVCVFWGRAHFLLFSPPFPLFSILTPSAYSFVCILFSSLVLPSPLSGPLCVFINSPSFVPFRSLVNSPPSLSQVRTIISRLGFSSFSSILRSCDPSSFCVPSLRLWKAPSRYFTHLGNR